MTSELVVALIGFGTALLGVVAAVLGRQRTQIHRHEVVAGPQPPQPPHPPAAPHGTRPLRTFGVVLIAAGLVIGAGWYLYSTYLNESRFLADWERFRVARGAPGQPGRRYDNGGYEVDGTMLKHDSQFYILPPRSEEKTAGEPATEGYSVYLFERPVYAERYVRFQLKTGSPGTLYLRNGGFVLLLPNVEGRRPEYAKVQEVFRAFR